MGRPRLGDAYTTGIETFLATGGNAVNIYCGIGTISFPSYNWFILNAVNPVRYNWYLYNTNIHIIYK